MILNLVFNTNKLTFQTLNFSSPERGDLVTESDVGNTADCLQIGYMSFWERNQTE